MRSRALTWMRNGTQSLRLLLRYGGRPIAGTRLPNRRGCGWPVVPTAPPSPPAAGPAMVGQTQGNLGMHLRLRVWAFVSPSPKPHRRRRRPYCILPAWPKVPGQRAAARPRLPGSSAATIPRVGVPPVGRRGPGLPGLRPATFPGLLTGEAGQQPAMLHAGSASSPPLPLARACLA